MYPETEIICVILARLSGDSQSGVKKSDRVVYRLIYLFNDSSFMSIMSIFLISCPIFVDKCAPIGGLFSLPEKIKN